MTVGDGIGRAGLHTIPTKNAARIIDVVDASVTLAGGNPLRVGVFRCLDVDTTRGAGRRAQETADALFQSTFVPVEHVDAAVSWLEMDGFFGIIFRDGFPQHVAEGYAKAFYERDERFASFSNDGRHRISV